VKASLNWLECSGAHFGSGSASSGCAQLTHYTVSYREVGSGPPIVLVPGLAGGIDLLSPLANCLAKNFRVITYQLRGEDDCFALRQPFQLSDLVTDLAEFIDWQCLESPTVFGVSFGGVLALEYAARYGHRLDRLIVQGVGARFEHNLLQAVAGTVLNRFPLPADNPFINQFFNLLFGGRQKRNALFHFVTSQCWQTDQSVMAHRMRLVESFDVSSRLHRIRVPSLILAGEKDVLVPPRSLAVLRDGIDDSQYLPLPKCGHLAFVTHPELVAAKVCEFLADELALAAL
jgi:pimeloyl-ACP methyl ester carboxylesterase